MPTLVMYSKYDEYTTRLRTQTWDFGWKTVRTDGKTLEPVDDIEIAIYSPPPLAFEIASALGMKLAGPPADWLQSLPYDLRKRKIIFSKIKNCLDLEGINFVKPALSKTFTAGVYEREELIKKVCKLHPELQILISDPVEFSLEIRCFIASGNLVHMSLYKRGPNIYEENWDEKLSSVEVNEAKDFITKALQSVEVPSAVVVDIGYIKEKGWAVIEANEIWASGLYCCPVPKFLNALKKACFVSSVNLGKWDAARHFYKACPHLEPLLSGKNRIID